MLSNFQSRLNVFAVNPAAAGATDFKVWDITHIAVPLVLMIALSCTLVHASEIVSKTASSAYTERELLYCFLKATICKRPSLSLVEHLRKQLMKPMTSKKREVIITLLERMEKNNDPFDTMPAIMAIEHGSSEPQIDQQFLDSLGLSDQTYVTSESLHLKSRLGPYQDQITGRPVVRIYLRVQRLSIAEATIEMSVLTSSQSGNVVEYNLRRVGDQWSIESSRTVAEI